MFNKYKAAQEEAAQAVEQNKQKYQNLTSEISALNTEKTQLPNTRWNIFIIISAVFFSEELRTRTVQ